MRPALLPLPLLFAACGGGEVCGSVCTVAQATFESCLDTRGQEYGASVGFESAEDFANWCDTWAWEQEQMGTESVCQTTLDALAGGDCAAWQAAWSAE